MHPLVLIPRTRLIAAALAFLSLLPRASAAAAAAIEFEATNHPFGTVFSGAPVRHEFVFHNVGNADLLIDRVQTGCGCTRIGAWTRRIPPGGEGAIPVELNTGGFVGAVEKTLTVSCNAGNQPTLTLSLQGTVRRAVEIRPSSALLNLGPDTPLAGASLRITNCLAAPLALYSPDSTNRELTAGLLTNLAGRLYELVISNREPLPPGTFTGEITLRTSLPDLPVLRVLAVANTTPSFTIAPPELVVGPADLTTGRVVYACLLHNGSRPAHLTEASLPAPGVRAAVREEEPGRRFTVALTFPAGFAPGTNLPIALEVRTSDPASPRLRWPVRFTTEATPAVPIINMNPQEVITAPLPLVCQRAAVARLPWDPDQIEGMESLQIAFFEWIGGLDQNPADPAYLKRWETGRRIMDSRLVGIIGRTGVQKLDQALAAPPGGH